MKRLGTLSWDAVDPLRKPPKAAERRARPVRDPLLHIDHLLDRSQHDALADDVRRGLTAPQKALPPKYFYDDRGSQLFDAICDLPEYYLTRAEQALLEAHADEIASVTRPTHVIELGSGASRKTRILLTALTQAQRSLCYVPVDVSDTMLWRSAIALRAAYPALRVHGVVADYEQHLDHLPAGERRLVLFLGSTIGNFTRAQATDFLRALATQVSAGDWLLIGLDLVKPVEQLHAAYNDARGITAEFNRNVLHVLNRELGATFVPERFAHVAFFNREASQIEMHLRADAAHEVDVPALDLDVSFAAGETIHTEISRKFTRSEAEAMLGEAGCRLVRWYTDAEQRFALALGAVERRIS